MDGIHNPILTAGDITDAPARFVADPFMVEHDGTYNLFFEFLNTQRETGEIGHALSRDMKTWTYTGTVLSEKFHLSYPYVFRHEGEMYMIPECAKSKSIRLYRATNFPGKWEQVTTIIKGDKRQVPLLDPSVVHHNGKWYLFSYMRKAKNLHLFVANSLKAHGKSTRKVPSLQEAIISQGLAAESSQTAKSSTATRRTAFPATAARHGRSESPNSLHQPTAKSRHQAPL